MNKFLLMLPFLFLSCTKKSPQTLIGLWEKKTFGVERKFASGGALGQCHQNTFNVSTLKEEIKALEKMFPREHELRGNWKHLNYSDLPLPQANFLRKYGEKIGDLKNKNAIDYSPCGDVPCLFNRIYGTPGGVAGYVHYLWFLKFGHLLSADNEVPVQTGAPTPGVYNKKQIPLKEYLLDKNELHGFWRLSKMLKAPHTNLSYMNEIQRVPRGESIQGADEGVCGRAHGHGWIILTDKCLWFEKNKDLGYFYQAVTHEISHQVDFQEGRGTTSGFRSHKADYLSLVGMSLSEYMSEDGRIVSEWKLKPTSKLISDYAVASPAESFAEDLALFRIDGDLAKKTLSEKHYKFISEKYYQGSDFQKENLLAKWVKEYDLKPEQFISQVSATEPEGCEVLKKKSVSQIKELINQNHETKTLADKGVSRDAYLECYGENDERSCYDDLVGSIPFEKIQQETLNSYSFFVESRIDTLERSAKDLWNGCRSRPLDDSERPTGSHFLISEGYMMSSLYNCLNANLPETIKQSVRDFSVDGVKLQHAKEEMILSQFVKLKLVQELHDKYEGEKIKERLRSEIYLSRDKDGIRDAAKADDCESTALKAITFEPVYHLKSELFSEFISEKVCSR